MKPRVLLVHNKLTPFVRIDRDLLRHRYDVEELAIAGRTATLWAVWQAVRRNDVVLCWFASAHGLLPALVARAAPAGRGRGGRIRHREYASYRVWAPARRPQALRGAGGDGAGDPFDRQLRLYP